MTSKNGNFGIIVSGGPAPGINSVIASVTFTATKSGHQVYGFKSGMQGLSENHEEIVTKLTSKTVSAIRNDGGSILGTSRFNPFQDEETKEQFIGSLRKNNIDKLVCIGGEGTAYLSLQISKHYPDIHVVHVPKTIDNDLILPNQYPSFGFETARYVGTKVLDTLAMEAKTTNRWFVVKSMGRNAGYLALGIGLASGAALTLIPEQFENGISTEDIVDEIMPTIYKRIADNRNYGIIIIAEGLIDELDPEKVKSLENIPRDAVGRLQFSKIKLEDLVLAALEKRCKEENIKISLRPENIGYTLRCADPVPFDLEYTKFLGFGAVKFLLAGKSGIMVVRNYDKVDYVTLSSMEDENGRIKSRRVDLESDFYTVAESFMIK